LQALRSHALAANPLNRPVSIPSGSTSTTSDWRRISVDSGSSPRHQSGSAKNAVVADVDSLLRKLSREQKRSAQLNAQLTLLDHDLKKENERAARNERELQDIRSQMSAATVARREAEHMLTRTQEQLQVAKSQFDAATKEIERAQAEIDALDKERQEAEESARRARERARELLLEMKIQDARRQGWEEGRKQGIEEGIRGGEMEGSRHGRRDGTQESRMMWEVGHKRLQHAKAQQAKVAARKQVAAAPETRARIPLTENEEDSDEEPNIPRNPGWGDEPAQRPSSHTGPHSRRGSLVSNISDSQLGGEPSPIRIRSPAPLDNPPLPRPDTAQSRSSRRSGGRARTGSDPTTTGGKSTPSSEFDLLHHPLGRQDVLSPIVETVSQIGSSPRPTFAQTPHASKRFSTPSGGQASTRSSAHTRTMSNPKSSSGSSFVAPPPEISVVTNTPPDARVNGVRGAGLTRSNVGSIRTIHSGSPGSEELIEPLGDPHQVHPYAMAGLDKGKQPIRPGLSSSTFVPPNLTSAHNAYSVHDVPSPNLSEIPGYGARPPFSMGQAAADLTKPPPSPRRRGGSSPLPATAMLPTPDSSTGMWQQTDPLVSPPETETPGGGLQRSSSWVGGFVRPGSRSGNKPGSRTGLGQGIMRIGGSIKRGIQGIARPPSAQQRPQNTQSQQPNTGKYIPPGRRDSVSPTTLQGPADLAATWRMGPRTTPSPQHFYGRQAAIVAQNSVSTPSPVGVIPNMATLRTGSTTPQGFGPPVPPKKSILKPPPPPDPVMISVDSSPSVEMSQMPPEVRAQVDGWRAAAAARGESTEDYYPTTEEKARRDAKDADRARRVQAGESVSPIPRRASEWEIVAEQPTTAPQRSKTEMMYELDESLTGESKNSSPNRPHVPPIDVILPPGGPGVGLGLGVGSDDVATLEREAEEYQWDARSQKLVQTPRASPFDIEIVPVCPISSQESLLMGTL